MDGKKSFGEYIRKKRQDAALTQRELADRLYVAESTVSKWERGLSYPDVSLIPEVCRALAISEHEFFTACDDDKAHAQERAARAWNRTLKIWQCFFAVCYGAAIVTCFICDLAVFHRLDWFWIVLTSLMLAFSFTNLPFLVEKNRLPICLAAATGSLALLLLSCWVFVGGIWILGGLAITAVCLLLPWGVWAGWRFYGLPVAPLSMALLTVWVFALLAVIRLFTGGGWLLPVAYPIAAVSLAFLWLYFAVGYWLPLGRWFKTALYGLLTAFAIPVINCFSNRLLPEPDPNAPRFADYFAWSGILTRADAGSFSWVNILVFAIMLVISVLLLLFAVIRAVRRKSLK